MKINAAVQSLLGSVDANPGAYTETKVATEFTFNTAPDKIGLPMEHPKYVKKTCKTCYGRGWQAQVIGDGYRDVGGIKVSNETRTFYACACVHSGYTKTRLAAQQQIQEAVDNGEDEGLATTRIVGGIRSSRGM